MSTSRWLKSFENVALEGVVDKEVTKQVEVYKELVMDMVVEEVNRELLKEFNEGLVLVCRCGDGLRGDHKVDGGGSGTALLVQSGKNGFRRRDFPNKIKYFF